MGEVLARDATTSINERVKSVENALKIHLNGEDEDTGTLSAVKVNTEGELNVSSVPRLLNRDTLIAATVEIPFGDSVNSDVIELDTLNFKREYKGLSIQARFQTLATGGTGSTIDATVTFYNATTALKQVTSAFVLTTANQAEVYHVLPDDMNFKKMKLTLAESGGASAHAHVEAYLIY